MREQTTVLVFFRATGHPSPEQSIGISETIKVHLLIAISNTLAGRAALYIGGKTRNVIIITFC